MNPWKSWNDYYTLSSGSFYMNFWNVNILVDFRLAFSTVLNFTIYCIASRGGEEEIIGSYL